MTKMLKLGEGMVTINLSKPAAYLATSHEGSHSDDNGPFEVFWVGHNSPMEDEQGCQMQDGWYWQPCSPGCLPDGEAEGPYDSSHEAYVAAFARVGEEPPAE